MPQADAFPFHPISVPARFAIAVASVSLVVLLRQTFEPLIDEGSFLMLLGVAVIASAWLGGTGPALLATVSGGIFAGRVSAADPADAAHLALFVLQGVLLTALMAELRRARWRAERHARLAEEARRAGEHSSRLKDEFLTTVSHELRTPLNAMLGWIHLLRTGRLDEDTAARGLESIERNARLQSQVTNNLLDISSALTGRMQIDSRPVPLGDIVRQAAEAASLASRAKGVAMTVDLPDEPVVVLGDWSRLRQVVWHLLTNALKFTPRGGDVRLEVSAGSDDVILRVVDSGPGIEASFLPRMFDPFTQEDSSPTRTAGGLGVGLSLVREIVERHGGGVTAENRTDRPGAVFTVRLPRIPETCRDAAGRGPLPLSIRPAAEGWPPLDGLRILILDRDHDGRDAVATVLEERGAAVRSTESVADALESLETWRPDVLVSDNLSPDQQCYFIFGKVPSLESERGGRIPALALTNLARTDGQVREMLASALCDLPKPVEPALLAAEIARLTGRERRRAAR